MPKYFRKAERITLLMERPKLSDSLFRRSSSSGSLANERINFGLRRLLSFSFKIFSEFSEGIIVPTIHLNPLNDKQVGESFRGETAKMCGLGEFLVLGFSEV
jgi:hypothetical protein